MPPNQKTDNLEKIKTFVAKIRKTIKSPDTDAAKRYDLFEAVLSDKINLETVNKLIE
jgi:asparagine synthetase A